MSASPTDGRTRPDGRTLRRGYEIYNVVNEAREEGQSRTAPQSSTRGAESVRGDMGLHVARVLPSFARLSLFLPARFLLSDALVANSSPPSQVPSISAVCPRGARHHNATVASSVRQSNCRSVGLSVSHSPNFRPSFSRELRTCYGIKDGIRPSRRPRTDADG